jgi:hypothetical protein
MLVLSSIGLMVGGVGVVAIMMISVTERTREIGCARRSAPPARDPLAVPGGGDDRDGDRRRDRPGAGRRRRAAARGAHPDPGERAALVGGAALWLGGHRASSSGSTPPGRPRGWTRWRRSATSSLSAGRGLRGGSGIFGPSNSSSGRPNLRGPAPAAETRFRPSIETEHHSPRGGPARIAAHRDDVELLCGGTLARRRRRATGRGSST